jgi:hypothetical protein
MTKRAIRVLRDARRRGRYATVEVRLRAGNEAETSVAVIRRARLSG